MSGNWIFSISIALGNVENKLNAIATVRADNFMISRTLTASIELRTNGVTGKFRSACYADIHTD
jgi:hypothetical protein